MRKEEGWKYQIPRENFLLESRKELESFIAALPTEEAKALFSWIPTIFKSERTERSIAGLIQEVKDFNGREVGDMVMEQREMIEHSLDRIVLTLLLRGILIVSRQKGKRDFIDLPVLFKFQRDCEKKEIGNFKDADPAKIFEKVFAEE